MLISSLVGEMSINKPLTFLTFFTSRMYTVTATAKWLQSCPTLCDPIDGSPPGSPVPGILQARTLEWVAISFSNAWKWRVKVKSLNRARLLVTPWTAAFQAPPSMGFSRQEYWSGVPLPSLSRMYRTVQTRELRKDFQLSLPLPQQDWENLQAFSPFPFTYLCFEVDSQR